jgi:hypothetical protein
MRGFFSYEWGAKSERMNLRVLTLFKTPGMVAPEDISAAVEEGAKCSVQPDVILIQFFWYDNSWIEPFKRSQRVQEIKDRLGTSTSVLLVKCKKNGRYDISNLNKGFANLVSIIEDQINSSRDAGLIALFDPKIVISKAPKGFAFRKPSGDHSTFFIHAQNALTDSDHVSFLAYCLLPILNVRLAETGKIIQTIYVDSMSIASVAFAIKELYQHIELDANPRIVSFHSHNGIKNTPKPLRGRSLCLISASSSMRLQRDWLDYSKCDPDEVTTLITFDDAEDADKALFRLKAKDKGPATSPQEIAGEIQIFGENFSASQIHPKRVELFKASCNVSTTAFAQETSRDAVLYLDLTGKSPARKKRGIHVEGDALFKLGSFKEWLLHQLKNGLPPRLGGIVFQNDIDSKEMATLVRTILANEFKLTNVPTYPHTDIHSNIGSAAVEYGLLIVAAQIGKGTSLLSLSRDLRGLHNGPRQYLVGAQLAHQNLDIVSLKKNIEFSSLKSNIVLNVFKSCSVGPYLENSFDSDRKLLRRFKSLAAIPQISARILASSGIASPRLLPGKSSLDLELGLRKDFAFWSKNSYDEGEKNQAGVVLTVAGMLQRAREDEEMPPSLRLTQAAIGSVVLDPKNFFRYNDGLIQAAILRCASSAELDYTCQAELSQQITEFLIKVIELIDDEFGEAALEFLFALATSRLSIRLDHMEKLRPVLQRKSNELRATSIGKALKVFVGIFKDYK